MTTAAIYVRISDDRSGEGLGVERQEAECRTLCAALGFVVSEVYSDNDLSATSGKVRPAFTRLIADAPPVVVVWHTDRLIRTSRDLEKVLDLGLTVHGVTAGHIDLSTPSGRAVARTVTAWATYEGEQRTLRQLAETKQRALSGRPQWNVRPFGYEMDGTLRTVEADAIRSAYTDALEGRSLNSIRAEWQAAYPDRTWYVTTVTQILRNARNAGIRTHRRVEVARGDWTPIVEEGVYRAFCALSRERGHTGTRKRTYLLSGLGICGRCGATLNASTAGHGTKQQRLVYQCSAKPGHLQRKAEPVEAALLEETLALLIYPGAREVMTDTPALDPALLEERATLTHRRDVELPEGLALGLSPLQVAQATKTINARIAVIDAAVAQARKGSLFEDFWAAPTGWPEVMEGARAVWDALPLHKRQGLVAALWDGVIALGGRGAPVLLVPSPMTRALLEQVDAERERVAASRALTAALRASLRA